MNRVERSMSQYKETKFLYEWFGPHMWTAWAIMVGKALVLVAWLYFLSIFIPKLTAC